MGPTDGNQPGNADPGHAAWALHRPEGWDRLCLGALRPGMTRAEATAAALPYGPVEQVVDQASQTISFEDLEALGLSAEEIAAARATLEAVAEANADIVTEYRALDAPCLDYTGGRLSRVATDHHCLRLTFLGQPVYAGDGLALLAALEAMDAGGALRAGDAVWFPRLGVTTIGFYGEREDGTVGLLDAPADRRIRHLALEAYEPVSDAPAAMPVTFRAP